MRGVHTRLVGHTLGCKVEVLVVLEMQEVWPRTLRRRASLAARLPAVASKGPAPSRGEVRGATWRTAASALRRRRPTRRLRWRTPASDGGGSTSRSRSHPRRAAHARTARRRRDDRPGTAVHRAGFARRTPRTCRDPPPLSVAAVTVVSAAVRRPPPPPRAGAAAAASELAKCAQRSLIFYSA